ncbi:hypothetical protein AAFX30_20275 [Vibrio chagasii]|uniref:hypothetical protein n=1 Tax=Vibrio TaxID=662 RepID=UPI0035A732AB
MRLILMSKPGEFKYEHEKDQSKAAAVKMLARILKKSQDKDTEVAVSNTAGELERTSQASE